MKGEKIMFHKSYAVLSSNVKYILHMFEKAETDSFLEMAVKRRLLLNLNGKEN